MKKNFVKAISTIILIAFCMQLFTGSGYAQTVKPEKANQITQKKNVSPKGITPKKEKAQKPTQEVANKKPVKIPPGIAKDEDKLNEWKDKKELIEKRWTNGKVYENSDGSRTAVAFLEPIHVKDSSGKFQEIDNTLKASKDNKGNTIYKNTRGLFDVTFITENKKPVTEYKLNNVSVTLSPLDFDVEDMGSEGNQIVYGMTGKDVQYEYMVKSTGVKENIVLNHFIDQNVFSYRMNVQGNATVEVQNGKILVKDKQTEIIYSISAPLMVDRENKVSKDLSFELEKDKDGYLVKLTVDDKWLADPNRAYPVIIDPEVIISGYDVTYDTFIQNGIDKNGNMIPEVNPDEKYYLAYELFAGYDELRGITRSIIQFKIENDELNSNSQITGALLRLNKRGEDNNGERNASVYRADRHIDIKDINWNNQPDIKETASNLEISQSSGYYRWNIEELVNSWVQENRSVAADGTPNYSNENSLDLVLKMEDEYSHYAQFDSSDAPPQLPSKADGEQPLLQIVYIPNAPTPTPEPTPTPTPTPTPVPEAGEFELVLERNELQENGIAYAKTSLEWSEKEKSKATVKYRLMPDNIETEEIKEDFSIWDIETEKYDLELDKAYWIEMDVKLEKWVETKPIPGATPDPETASGTENETDPSASPAPGKYEPVYEESFKTDKFVVGEIQPGDTLRKLSKHYLDDGDKYTDIFDLNKLEKEQLIVGQKLFVMTEKEEPYNYKQPSEVTPEMEIKDGAMGPNPIRTETVGQFINPNTGNFAFGVNEFDYMAYNYPLVFTRSYNSTAENVKSSLGDRWDYSFNKYLFFYEDGTIGFNRGDGSRTYYRKNYNGNYSTSSPTYEVLEPFAGGYKITAGNNIQYIFSEEGLFTGIIDTDKNRIDITYDSSDWQKTIKDSLSRSINLEYYNTDEMWPGNLKKVTLPDQSCVEYSYTNGSNHLEKSYDRRGYKTEYSYLQDSRLTDIILPELNRMLKNSYDGKGRVTSQQDGELNTIDLSYGSYVTYMEDAKEFKYEYHFNQYGWITKKLYPDQNSEQYSYYGNTKTYTDRRGQSHVYTYNEKGNLLSYNMTGVKSMSYEYKDGYLPKKITDFEENVTDIDYDSNNHLKTVTQYVKENEQTKEIKTNYIFTAKGLLSQITDPDGVVTKIDNSAYPSKQIISDINNYETVYYYDILGRTLDIEDAAKNHTRYSYNENGQLLSILQPGNRLTSYSYDRNGRMDSQSANRVVPETGKTPATTYKYYNNGLLKQIIDPYLEDINYTYDSNNNVQTVENKDGNISKYYYNNLNRLEKFYEPGQELPGTTYYYDLLGNVQRVIEADNDWISYSYDYKSNQVDLISGPDGLIKSMKYDLMGNLHEEMDASQRVTTYELDNLYRLTKLHEPGQLVSEYKYYPSGRTKQVEDVNNKIFDYIYYSDGKLRTRTESYYDEFMAKLEQPLLASTDMTPGLITNPFANNSLQPNVSYTVEYTNDERGNIRTVKNEEGLVTTYDYNEINKVKKVTLPGNKYTNYNYDMEGNLEAVLAGENGDKNKTVYKYDALNRLYKMEIPSENTTYTYFYYPSGLLKEAEDPNRNSVYYQYDERGRLELSYNDRDEKTFYSYYEDNNLKTVQYPNLETVEYKYDQMNRVYEYMDRAKVTHNITYNPAGSVDLVYDSAGNRTDYSFDYLGRVNGITDNLKKTKSFTYNSKNQVDTVKGFDGNVTGYSYDPRGRVREILDPEKKLTSYDYNGSNQVTSLTKPGERTYSYEYDISGNLWRVKDPLLNETEYYYDDRNLLSEVKNGRDYSKKYTYNALNKVETFTNEREYPTTYDYYPGGLLKTVIDAKGNPTDYTYNELNKIETVKNALNETTTYSYDGMGRLDTVMDHRGVWTKYTYTLRDQVEYTFDSLNNYTQNMYYPNGDLWKAVDKEQRFTEYKYDAGHRVTNITVPGGYSTSFVYDPVTGDIKRKYDNAGGYVDYEYDIMHRLLNETNQQEHKTVYTYDDLGNLTSKTAPDKSIISYDYDDLGRITSILDPEKKLTEIHYDPVGNIDRVLKDGTQEYIYGYDRANNLERVLDPLKRETIYTYDANNNVETMLTPTKNLITYNYDPLNRLKGTIDLLNGSKGYGYDTSGNINAITDGNGYTTKYHYDNRNLLEWVEDAEGNKTSYTYYNDGKLKTMTDGRDKTSKYTYTDAGYLKTFENPLGEIKEFQYTLLGQIDKIIKPDGNPIDYIYDELNRLDTILYPDETTVEYQYDDLNRKTAMADKNGVTEYDYDTLGRLTKTIDPANEEVEFEYDEKGRKSKVIYPDDKFVTYDYDEHDRLVTITDRENRITTYTYDEAGRKKTVKLPNGIATIYIYDVANKVKEIISTKEDGSVVEKIAYEYDGEGNKTLEEIWKEDKHYKRVYSYYKNNTVKGMSETGDNTAEYTYHYDGAGNIDEKTVTEDGITKTYTYSYNDANRMVTESENGEVRRSYAYDLNGNRTQRIISDDGKPVADYYYYDYTDQLEEVVEHSGKVYTYGYDGEGNRLWRTYSQYPVVKPPVDDGERVEDPAEFPGWNKDKDSELDHDNGKGNDFKVEGEEKKGKNLTSRIEKLMNINLASSDSGYLKNLMFAKKGENKENGQGNSGDGNGQNNGNGNSSSEVNNGKDKEPGNGNNTNVDKENGKGSDNGKNNSNGNGKDKNKAKDNGNSDKSKVKDNDKEKDNNGQDKNEKENGNGWAKGKDKDKAKGDRGKHLGWYKNGKAGNGNGNDPHNPGGDKLVNPEIFQVTNYINDLSTENEEVLMTSDVDGNYRGVYTYDNNHDLIGVEDLGEIQGKPNDPLYYLKDTLRSITSITNMNGEIIDSNRFAPYGEPIDPVAKNARLTNSPYGYTGESHDIEGGLIYLRARYYEPATMRFLQQDTLLGDIQQPLTRNLYIYGNANPLKFVDPSGHFAADGSDDLLLDGTDGGWYAYKSINDLTWIWNNLNDELNIIKVLGRNDPDYRDKYSRITNEIKKVERQAIDVRNNYAWGNPDSPYAQYLNPEGTSYDAHAFGMDNVSTKPSISTLSNDDIVFNSQNITWKYISESEYNTFMLEYAASIVNTFHIDMQVLGPRHLKGNENLNLTAEQLAYLFLTDPWGAKIYLTYKDNEELTKNVFKILYEREPKHYSLIDGSWTETSNWTSSNSYSEADVFLTCKQVPVNLVQAVTVGLAAATIYVGVGELILFAEGVSIFGFRNALTMYSYSTLQSAVNYQKGLYETGGRVATVEELITMMNQRANVTAEFAEGDALSYLQAVEAEASHMMMENGLSSILIRQDVATRRTCFHEWLHRYLQLRNGGNMRPGEDDMIEAFLNRFANTLKLN